MRNGEEYIKDGAPTNPLKKLHAKLANPVKKETAVFPSAEDAVLILNSASGKICEVSPKAAFLTGYEPSLLMGMELEHLIPGQDFLSKIMECDSGDGCRGLRAIVQRRDDTCLYVEVGVSPLQKNEKALELVKVRGAAQEYLSGTGLSHCASDTLPSRKAPDEDLYPMFEFPNIIGKSQKIRSICQLIGQVAKTDSTVLIQGESGTGKEVVARAIHVHSNRQKGPFVKVNCVALSETLLESELFGHIRGAFTGAIRDRRGRFRQADGGTIFLDEIGCMSPAGQAKLLRVLEEKEFEPVGSSNTMSVDARIIAATKIDLQEAVAQNKFRDDLFFRLNVFSIFAPPLRERKEDIPLLAKHFLKEYNLIIGKQLRDFTPETIALMMQYDWPGNIRELRNAIEHAVIIARDDAIKPFHLPANLTFLETMNNGFQMPAELGLRQKLTYIEKKIILDALRQANGVKKHAATILKIDPRNFSYLLKKHGLIKDTIINKLMLLISFYMLFEENGFSLAELPI